CEDGAGRIGHWAEPPAGDAENPVLAQPLTSSWPVPPGAAGGRYEAVREGGDLVLTALSAVPQTPVPQAPVPQTPVPQPPVPQTPVPQTPVPQTPVLPVPAPRTPVLPNTAP